MMALRINAPFSGNSLCGGMDRLLSDVFDNLDQGVGIVIATDGLRTVRDFNHRTGLNVLRGDNSVNWLDNATDVVQVLAGSRELADDDDDDDTYTRIWEIINGGSDGS